MKSNRLLKFRLGKHRINRTILNNVKKADGIVYGSQAIRRKLGILSREPTDFDVFVSKPKKTAFSTEKDLDKLSRIDNYFVKKGANISTYKVKFKGKDGRARTKDDIGVADFTKIPKPKPKSFSFRGVQYRNLKEELKAKERLVKSPQFAFRREKDIGDLERIKRFFGRRK